MRRHPILTSDVSDDVKDDVWSSVASHINDYIVKLHGQNRITIRREILRVRSVIVDELRDEQIS